MRFAIAGIIFIMVSALCFVLFILFNNVLYNTDNGIEVLLDETAKNTMSNKFYQSWQETTDNIQFGFGLAGVACMGTAFLLFIAEALTRPRFEQ
jgi:hypothetical protein